jgi:hypothetical protein
MNSSQLAYERRPQVGNVLVDEDESGVVIRIVHDHGRAWGLAIPFALVGIICTAIFLFNFRYRTVTWEATVLVAGAVFFFLLALWAIAPGRGVPSSMVASPNALQHHDGRLATTQNWPREQIVAIHTEAIAGTTPETLFSLILDLRDDEQVFLGVGSAQEVQAMAAAIRKGLELPQE